MRLLGGFLLLTPKKIDSTFESKSEIKFVNIAKIVQVISRGMGINMKILKQDTIVCFNPSIPKGLKSSLT